MTGDTSKSLWSPELSSSYESANYGPGLAGWVLRTSHALVEAPFASDMRFDRVIEVGAGSGVHLRYVRHTFGEYLMTDGSAAMLEQIPAERRKHTGGTVKLAEADCTRLAFADASFDRLVATHVLEHVPFPHAVLQEWARVVRPGGTLSIVLPCDPGLAWRMGRYLGPRASARKRGIDYDYVMALEHINAITNLVAIIRHQFPRRQERWWPLRVPSSDLNLIYAVNITR